MNQQKKTGKQKRQTWTHADVTSAKKMNLYLAIITLISSVSILWLCFLPVAKVEGVSLGNYYYFAEIFIKNLLSKLHFLSIEIIGTELYNDIMHTFTLVCALLILNGIIMFLKGISYIVAYYKNKSICLDKLKKRNVIFSAIISCILLLTIIAYLHIWEELFLFRTLLQWLLVLLMIFNIFLTMLIKIICLKKCEKITKEKAYHILKDKNAKEEHYNIGYEKTLAICILIIGLIFQILTSNFYFKTPFIRENEMPDCIMGEYLTVGEKVELNEISLKFYNETVASVYFGSTPSEFKSEYSISWGKNYYFYQKQIELITEEQLKLMPNNISEDATIEEIEKKLDEYARKIKELEKKKQALQQALRKVPVPIETVKFGTIQGKDDLIVKELIYNTNRIDKSKYKYAEGKSSHFSLYKESITLNQSRFPLGTDFSNQMIIATVKYKDGSVKISIISPENSAELNNSGKGTHFLTWTDNWGTYNTKIVIE